MRTCMSRMVRSGAVAALACLLTACGDTVVQVSGDVDSEAAGRAGERAFKDAGHEIDGRLTCDATGGEDDGERTVTCNGATTKGEHARLTVTLGPDSTTQVGAEDQTLVDGGRAIGTVDGKQVFSKSCIGAC